MKGSCCCGAVSFTISGAMKQPVACHCSQCRKSSGHLWAAGLVGNDALHIEGDSLSWYKSSDWAERGFCSSCGSSLFWRMPSEDSTSVALGSLDETDGITLHKHIYVADKGDYYDIPETEEQLAKY